MNLPADAAITFAGTLTRAEFERVQAQLQPVWARWFVLYPAMLGVFCVVTLPGARLSELVADLVFVVGFPLAMALFFRVARTRAWKQATRMAGRVHGTISAQGIEWNTERTTARFEWDRIERVKHVDGLTLAFHAKRGAFCFPRSFFESEAAWTAFNAAIGGYAQR